MPCIMPCIMLCIVRAVHRVSKGGAWRCLCNEGVLALIVSSVETREYETPCSTRPQGFVYAWLTTFKYTGLIHVPFGSRDVQISRAYDCEADDPSVAQALYWLLDQAGSLPEHQQPRTAEQIPGASREAAAAGNDERVIGEDRQVAAGVEPNIGQDLQRGGGRQDGGQQGSSRQATGTPQPGYKLLPMSDLELFLPLGHGQCGTVTGAR